ncbi:MAG: ferredoxin [Deltaproteobacteria bacterium]|nr:ferredoxin [Deltaproteobacteria bacterium]
MKYRIKVNKDECLEDAVCFSMDPDHFEEDEDGKAQVVGGSMEGNISAGEFDDDGYEDAKEAADLCPAEAIIVEKLE